MTEQELRAELQEEYQQKLDAAYAEMQQEMEASYEGAMSAIDDYKNKTESKLVKYRTLTGRLNVLREQKKMADLQHQAAVEDIIQQLSTLEKNGPPDAFMQGCAPIGNCCSPKKMKKVSKSMNVMKGYDPPIDGDQGYGEAGFPPYNPLNLAGAAEKDYSYNDPFMAESCGPIAHKGAGCCPSKKKGVKHKFADGVKFLANEEDAGPWASDMKLYKVKYSEAPDLAKYCPPASDDCCDMEGPCPDDFCNKISDK